jgi:hypothetical protein
MHRWFNREPHPPSPQRVGSEGGSTNERYVAVSHGHSKEAVGAGRLSMTRGGGGGRNCMACKGSGFALASRRGAMRYEPSKQAPIGQAQRPQRLDRRPDPQVAGGSAQGLHQPCRARPADRPLVDSESLGHQSTDEMLHSEPEPNLAGSWAFNLAMRVLAEIVY